MSVVLDIAGLTIALPPGADRVDAVAGVSLQLHAGEVTCLIGESGSGKSLVARSILGLLPERVRVREGAILFQGQDLVSARPPEMRAIRGAGIAMIFQEPMTALNPLHRIGRQIAEVLHIHSRLRGSQQKARVLELLDSVHLPEPTRLARSYPHQLSGGQRQRAMIAMALALNPKLLIADEPTTALDVTTQAQILHLIRELQREHGTAVLFITHDFGVVADIADSVAVLQRGTLVEQGSVAAVLGAPQHPYTQALIAAVPKLVPPVPRPASTAPFVIQASKVVKVYGARGLFGGRVVRALDGVDMTLRQGETLGLVGESGSGKSTLARAVTRLMAVDGGEILLSGHDIAGLGRRELRPYRKRVQMVFQDPYGSLDPRQKVVDIIAEGPIIHGTAADVAREEALELLGLVGLDASAAGRFPHEFSGGQRQRIGIARALALRPEVLVADEPVSALDVSVQAQVLALLADIKARLRLSMLFVTHDLRVALQVCDRIAVMRRGQVVEVASTADIFARPQHAYTRELFAAGTGSGMAGMTDAFVSRVRVEGAAEGPLAGLSFAVKDLIDVAGVPTGGGNPDWPRYAGTPERHAWVVETLLGAGASVVGKTVTDEVSLGILGENAFDGTPLNPAAPDRVPGGSSSGSASAVAAGDCDFALGTDSGGSVRVPSSFCGLYGIRPTHGRIDFSGITVQSPSADTCGWFARDASTFARVGAVLCGEAVADGLPTTLLVGTDAFGFADEAVQDALAPMVERLAGLIGVRRDVTMAPPGLSVWQRSQRVLQSSESWRTFEPWLDTCNPRMAWSVARGLVQGSLFTDQERNAATLMRMEARARMRALLPAGTILCLPTTPFPAPLKGLPVSVLGPLRERISCLTSHGGLTGVPQVNLPGAVVDGAPVGLSIVGGRGTEMVLMRVALAFSGGAG